MPEANKPHLVNLDYLRTISDGNEAFEKSMLAMYLKLTPKELTKMLDGLKAKDFGILQSGAHKLVSSVGLLGVESMKEKLLEIEILALTKTDLTRINVLLQEIISDHDKVALELKEILNQQP
jgi:HPt (histidine-containing phosphotransfer) domain-containing protein